MTRKNRTSYKEYELNSGLFREGECADAVADIKEGYADLILGKDTYTGTGSILGRSLKKGDLVGTAYNRYNQGFCAVEILGISLAEDKYGESGAHFDTVREALDHYIDRHEPKSLKRLYKVGCEIEEALEYGHHHYLIVRDLNPESGDDGIFGMYLNENGRWCRGSGEEPVSFFGLELVTV